MPLYPHTKLHQTSCFVVSLFAEDGLAKGMTEYIYRSRILLINKQLKSRRQDNEPPSYPICNMCSPRKQISFAMQLGIEAAIHKQRKLQVMLIQQGNKR